MDDIKAIRVILLFNEGTTHAFISEYDAKELLWSHIGHARYLFCKAYSLAKIRSDTLLR